MNDVPPLSSGDDDIDRFLRQESFRLDYDRKMEEARQNIEAARKALGSPERKMEYDLLAEMSRMIQKSYKDAGFSDEQAIRFSLMITHHAMREGLQVEEDDDADGMSGEF